MTNPTTARPPARHVPQRPDTIRAGAAPAHERGFVDGWVDLPWALRILRGFLGATFLFAGAQKLLDPNFLRAGSADFVGTQLHGFAQGTPAGPMLGALAHAPVVAGVAIALIEIAIGVGTLMGVAPLTAAFGGFAVSLTLLLSATWHVHPYFLGSDSIYAVAWLALFAGIWQMERERTGRLAGPLEVIDHVDRRQILRGAAVGGLTLVVAAASKAFSGPAVDTLASGPQPKKTDTGPTGPTSAPPDAGHGAPSVPGRTITTLDQLPVGEAIGFTAPGVGASVLVRLAADEVVAYSRTCTHAGCLVGYDASNRILFCPCHGAEFDPARGAAAIAGPTSTALPTVDVVVDQSTRSVILPS